jgi:VanZ family protein
MPTRLHTARFAWCLALLAVVLGELLPGDSLAMREWDHLELGDKLEHFMAYAVLSFYPAAVERAKRLVPAAFGMILLGVLLEFAQLFVEGRSFEIGDMAANTCGVLAGVGLGLLVRRMLARRAGETVSGTSPAPPTSGLLVGAAPSNDKA